jgi:cob(I)alamin adenosyltransferase
LSGAPAIFACGIAGDLPEKKSALYVRDSLADAGAAIARLFQALPEIDEIGLPVGEPPGDSIIMARTVVRSTEELGSGLLAGMRQRGIKHRSDGFRFVSRQA